jgi:uncharacterized protein
MTINPFLNAQGRLRGGWWIVIFFLLLAALLVPLILYARDESGDVPIIYQLGAIAAVSLIAQILRRRPISDLVGALDVRWPRQLLIGMGAGALLMALPAGFLDLIGAVSLRVNAHWADVIGPSLKLLAVAAATEELLFRGFVFQRLIDSTGVWAAQAIVAAFFLLTHLDAIQGHGVLTYLAGVNIFLASIMFGVAYLRTRSLALPLGVHFGANAAQGPLLGFGVSGNEQPGLLTVSTHASDWLTGGAFGLEASVPGLIGVIVLTFALARWATVAGVDGERV